MTQDQVVRFYGSTAKAADALGTSKQYVSKWRTMRIPTRFQLEAERDSDGKLKADRQARKEAQAMAAYLEPRAV